MVLQNSRIGETKLMTSCNMIAKIIDYKRCEQITVEFENGEQRQTSYSSFKKGIVTYPSFSRQLDSRIGETRVMNNGMKAKIIAYRGSKDIDVCFENGTVRTKVNYIHFLQGKLTLKTKKDFINSELRIGETKRMNNGLKATIIEITKHNSSKKIQGKIKIRFENGIEKYTQYGAFKNGYVTDKNKPDQEMRLGMTICQNCGLNATIIKYNAHNDFLVKFDDGEIIKGDRFELFLNGNIIHPLFHSQSTFKYHFLECKKKLKTKDNIYYYVKCDRCGLECIMTANEIINHYKNEVNNYGI